MMEEKKKRQELADEFNKKMEDLQDKIKNQQAMRQKEIDDNT